MNGSAIEITKEAIRLFLQSLPAGSNFQIISFGSKFQFLNNDVSFIDYTDENLTHARDQV